MLKQIVVCSCLLSLVVAEVEEEIVHQPPKPYAFGYAAGRFPGHIDRTHSEVSDGSGVVQGSYSYVDPNYNIRKVDYIADQNGFHPILSGDAPSAPHDTPAVAAAKQNHLIQYARIAYDHQQNPQNVAVPVDSYAVNYARNKHLTLFQKIAEEHARIAAERETLRLEEDAQHPNSVEH